MRAFLAYATAVLLSLWGISHVLPTRRVTAGFGPISKDNRLVLVQEWLLEAVTMWTLAALVTVATAIRGDSDVTSWLYRATAVALLVIGAVTGATGARTPVIWFKVCVGLMTVSAGLLVGASFA